MRHPEQNDVRDDDERDAATVLREACERYAERAAREAYLDLASEGMNPDADDVVQLAADRDSMFVPNGHHMAALRRWAKRIV